MNQEYLLYTQKIKHVGDKVDEISNNIKLIDITRENSLLELKEAYQSLLNAIEPYKKCKIDLLNINPPEIVKQEHILLSNALQNYIDGTALMIKAIDINLFTVNKDLLIKGMFIQKQGIEQTVMLTNKIDVLVKNS